MTSQKLPLIASMDQRRNVPLIAMSGNGGKCEIKEGVIVVF
jgi:hypothetical protein